MCCDLFRKGEKMSFSQYKTHEELDQILRKIFTNNPYFWSDRPLYLDGAVGLNNVVKGMLTNRVNVYEHKFAFVEPDENKREESILYDYCFDVSKARSNPLLPLVYYNAFLYLDSLGLSIHRIDNVSKIMYVRKNKYDSILNEMRDINHRYELDSFFYGSDQFDDIDLSIHCECGSVEAYRVDAGIFYGVDGYVIFPFPTKNDGASMYYFEMA
jgi:hypothetical protein